MRRRVRPRERELTAPPRHASLAVRGVLRADAALSLASGVAAGLALLGAVPTGGLPAPVLVAALPVAVLRAVLALRASRLVGNATVWRRRLGVLDVAAALALSAVPAHLKAATVLWTGTVWIACIEAARAIARLYVAETGAESPSEH